MDEMNEIFFECLGGVLAGLLSTGHIMIIFMTLVSLTAVRLLLQESSCNFFNNDESQGSSSRDFFHADLGQLVIANYQLH